MNIYDAIKKDHVKVGGLLARLVSLTEKDEDQRESLINQIRDDLVPHARAEESLFYNPLRELDADTGTMLHAYGEHMEAEALLRTLQVADKINVGWLATANKLKEVLEHHIAEEEGKVFTLAKKILSDEEAEKMGAAFERLKPEIREEGILKQTFDMIVNLVPPRLSKYLKSPESAPKSH